MSESTMPRRKAKPRPRAGGSVSAWARSDVGRRREKNEDHYLIDPSLLLFLVADGMGGHAGGETASRMAVDTVHRAVGQARRRDGLLPVEADAAEHAEVLEVMQDAVRQASRRIFEASARKPALHGMGTTLTSALVLGPRIYVAHVGDSRMYRLRDGRFEQLTEDHSLVAEQVRAGFITEEEAQFSRFRNIITRSVGFESQVDADTFSVAVQEGDVFLLCSDGLTGMVDEAVIEQTLKQQRMQRASEHLVDLANRAGGEDNITVVLLRYKGGSGRSVARRHRRSVGKHRRLKRKNG